MKIIIPGDPLAKTRHRCGCLHGKPRAYDPQVKKMEEIRGVILNAWNDAFSNPTSETAIEANCLALAESFNVSCLFVFTPPRSFNTRQTNRLLWGLETHNVKPDLDNLAKLYLDCANGILWPDDAKINVLNTKKIFEENARTELTIMAKENLIMTKQEIEILETLSPNTLESLVGNAYQLGVYRTDYAKDISASRQALIHDIEVGGLLNGLSQFAMQHADDLVKIKKITQKYERQGS